MTGFISSRRKILKVFGIAFLVLLLIATCSALTSCAAPGSETVSSGGVLGGKIARWHDDEKAVTCWTFKDGYAGGISCIPDHLLKPTNGEF